MDSETRNCRLITSVIIFNMIMGTTLLVYLFHVLVFGGVAFNGQRPSADAWWPMRITIAVMAFVVVTIQLTVDLILLKNLPYLMKAIQTCKNWMKITTAFQVLQILGFLFSIFHETQDSPYYIMPLIVVTGIASRAFALYVINSLLTILKAQASGLLLQPGHISFLSLPPQFYRSSSHASINSIAPYV